MVTGKIFKIESKDYYIFNEYVGEVRSVLPGKFKKEYQLKKDKLYTLDVAAVGDTVDFELAEDGTGIIRNIKERKNYLSRKAPRMKGASYRGERLEQIIASNLDDLFIMSSVRKPKFNNRMVDRCIVAGESSHININLVINKTDMTKNKNYLEWKDLYDSIGYKVFLTSAVTGEGMPELRQSMKGRTVLFLGSSGVGKSSLLNKLFPGLNFKVGSVSNYHDKGKHTTVTSILRKVEKITEIIDTPGIREIDPYGIRKEDLGHYFIEFLPYLHDCKFNTCTHYHEPGCAVEAAVAEGRISEERYESYLNLLDTIEEDMIY